MSDTTPNAPFEQFEDAQGHAFVSDPGEIGVETGQGKRPEPGADDTAGHVMAQATGDGTEDDTEGHKKADWMTSDGTEDDTEGHRAMSSTVTDDGTDSVYF